MYRISKWKLVLIILVFVFTALYLLPTVPGLYGRLYGYLSVKMQNKMPQPDVQSGEAGEFIRFVIPDDLPKGVNVVEASQFIQDIVGRRLTVLGAGEEVEEIDESEGASQFSFDSIVLVDLYVRLNQMRSRAELEDIVSKLELGGETPLLSQPPELPDGEYEGSIKLTITEDDVPEGKSLQDVVRDVQSTLREQLTAQEITDTDFSFAGAARNEVHVRFKPQRSRTEMDALIEELHLYGGIPLALRSVFSDKELKQGLDLKGGFHVVQELDVKKAMDMYLDNQAKEVVLAKLRGADILRNERTGVRKTLELDKRGNNTVIVRPYGSKSLEITEVQAIAKMREKLANLGFTDIKETEKKTPFDGPELTAQMGKQQDIGELVDSILGGNNPLIVTVNIRQQLQDDARKEYLREAVKTLDELELFDAPQLLQEEERTAVYSLQLSEGSAKKLAEQNIEMVMETLENRINKFGVAESDIRRVRGRPRIQIQIPEEQNPAKTLKAITDPAILTFKLVIPNPITGAEKWWGGPGTPEPSPDELPQGTEIRQHAEGGWRVVESDAFMVGGQHLKSNSATVGHDQLGRPEVIMFLNGEGQRKFRDFTGQHVGDYTAILLDDVIHTDPRINERISTASARISGDFTEEEADYLAKILKAGSFPAPMKIVEKRVVGPKLGQAAINTGKLAFVIGITLVVLFMLIYYKASGGIAVIALLFNFQIILAILAGLGAALTLPGMAGLILTVGMSVDANVLILERIRDELRSGKTVRSSIDSGYQKAFWTILDANVTTLLIALVLYEFGTGPIKGFAVTLSIGIIASMFTALFVTREIYRWIYRKRTITKLSI
ncbi:protein translocase subunit SecD [Candidatus Poribacteria bacterium]